MKDRNTSNDARLLRQLSDIEPPPEVMQRALERTRKALANSPIPARDISQANWRHRSRHILQVAAAIVAVLLVAVGGAYFLFFATSGATSAFAQVQSAIEQAHALRIQWKWNGPMYPRIVSRNPELKCATSPRIAFDSSLQMVPRSTCLTANVECSWCSTRLRSGQLSCEIHP